MENKKRKAIYNRKADLRYLESEKAKANKNYLNKKSVAKNFILKSATDEDIILVREWLNERINEV